MNKTWAIIVQDLLSMSLRQSSVEINTLALLHADVHSYALDNKTPKNYKSARAHLQQSENVVEMRVEYCRIVVQARRVSNFREC